jgi:hypothetical protein
LTSGAFGSTVADVCGSVVAEVAGAALDPEDGAELDCAFFDPPPQAATATRAASAAKRIRR